MLTAAGCLWDDRAATATLTFPHRFKFVLDLIKKKKKKKQFDLPGDREAFSNVQ